VRIDSGDLAALARSVRSILDAGGLKDTGIFVSGGIDEDTLIRFGREEAPIDGIGIGTSLVTSSDAPALDCAYKLQEYAGLPRRKRSTGKATWPGRKQVWRRYDKDGRMVADVLSVEGELHDGETLVDPVMEDGRRVGAQRCLRDIRLHACRAMERLPLELKAIKLESIYPVQVSASLQQLAAEADRRTGLRESQA